MVDIDFNKAIEFIKKNSSPIDKTRFFFLYNEEVPQNYKDKLFKVINTRKDGELFSLDFELNNPPSVISTIYFISHFQDAVLTIKKYDLTGNIVQTLLPYQQEDGSWTESTELLEWEELPEWADTNIDEVKLWVSSLATSVLSSLPSSFVPINIIQKGINYLADNINSEAGGLNGYIHSTFVAAPLIYAKMLGKKEFIEKTHKLLEQTIEENNFAGTLGWYLEQLSQVTTPKIRPLLVEIFRKIKHLQFSDGSFGSEDGDDDQNRAQATVQVLIGYLKAEERIKTFQKPKNLV